MNGADTFFASEGLADLLGVSNIKLIQVEINSIKCRFISFSNVNRVLRIELDSNTNPFEIFNKVTLETSIIFGDGDSKLINYVDYAYKIEQSPTGFVVTIGDKDE